MTFFSVADFILPQELFHFNTLKQFFFLLIIPKNVQVTKIRIQAISIYNINHTHFHRPVSPGSLRQFAVPSCIFKYLHDSNTLNDRLGLLEVHSKEIS